MKCAWTIETRYEISKIRESLSSGRERDRIRKIPTPKKEFQIPTSKYLVVVFT
jgi:hypothetical protein